MKKVFFYIVVVIFLLTSCEKEPIIGRIEGKILDASSIHIPYATVWIKNDMMLFMTMSDSFGHYEFDTIPVGRWKMSTWKRGYLITKDIEVDILGYESTNKDLTLYKSQPTGK